MSSEERTDGSNCGYEAPELIELGPMVALTLANGNHFGKVGGGSDAFLMRGHGAITDSSA
jgi:hypothetical protein